MPNWKWDHLSEKQQELYVKGFLETFSFFVYGISTKDKESGQKFSDMTACAEYEPAKRWTQMPDWLFGDLKATVASQCFKNSGYICQKYIGKGDGKWKPIQLVSANEWSQLSPEDKEIYGTAYLETADVMSRKAKQDKNVEHLENCIKNGGDARFLAAVQSIPIESENPMPWSVAHALGKACP